MSEKPVKPYVAGVEPRVGALRKYTEEPCGPLEVLVMSMARDLHDAERPDDDWFGLVGSSVSSFCRRACEARRISWTWMSDAIRKERMDETTERR